MTTGDRGQASKTWSTYATVWAAVDELSGRKLELARQLVATASHKLIIRYHADLTVKDRVVWGDKTLWIGHVENWSGMGFTQTLTCTEQLTGS